MKIDEKTTLPLSLVWFILCTVVAGVAGGAIWATKMDLQVNQLVTDMAQVKQRLNIQADGTVGVSVISENTRREAK